MANLENHSPAADAGTPQEIAQFDVIVIGAGVTGLYSLYRLRAKGLSVQVFDDGGGVGGASNI